MDIVTSPQLYELLFYIALKVYRFKTFIVNCFKKQVCNGFEGHIGARQLSCPSEPRPVGIAQLTFPLINAIDCKYVVN